jgi:hypothetical protein
MNTLPLLKECPRDRCEMALGLLPKSFLGGERPREPWSGSNIASKTGLVRSLALPETSSLRFGQQACLR